MKTAAERFQEEGMLLAECMDSGWFVVDRRPMNPPERGNHRFFKPFQLTSPDQSQYKLFTTQAEATEALAVMRGAKCPLIRLATETAAKLAA